MIDPATGSLIAGVAVAAGGGILKAFSRLTRVETQQEDTEKRIYRVEKDARDSAETWRSVDTRLARIEGKLDAVPCSLAGKTGG